MKIQIFLMGLLLVNVGFCKEKRNRPQVDPDCECGRTGDEIATRIVGGTEVIPHSLPWVVAIFHKGSLHCGGALINNRYVLTAGHCVRWIGNHKNLAVGLGMHNIHDRNTGYIVKIEQLKLHRHFVSDYLHDTHDIALIKLKHPIEYTKEVQPICLPVKGSDYNGKNVKVAGWGRVKTGGGASSVLQEATLKVMPYAQCRNTSLGAHLSKSMTCAYSEQKDACQGDSGGPLLFQRDNLKYETIGIVSWGIGCATPGLPGVYVKVTDYLQWIKRHTKDASYCVQ